MDNSLTSDNIAQVKKSFSNTATLQKNDGSVINAKLHKKILRPVCGDLVKFSKNKFNEYIIEDVLARKNELKRKVKDNKLKIFAANITQMLIVVAVKPGYSRYLIDRYIAYAETNKICPIVILNKSDLLDIHNTEQHKNAIHFYSTLGYKTIIYSSKSGKTTELTPVLNNNMSILVGQSGVGKSSLIKQLFPDQNIVTGELSKKTNEGTHTTTHTELYDLPFGGSIIDSPGVREFTPCFTDKGQIQHGFRDFLPLLNTCKYRNCLHHHEQGCEIKKAVQEEKISQLRYNSYIDILKIYDGQ